MCDHTKMLTRRRFINTASGALLFGLLSPMPALASSNVMSEDYISVQPGLVQRIQPTDECFICGMTIAQFAGPKGQVYLRNSNQVRKFCATKDLFSFALDPEFKHQIKQIYVHDMARMSWDQTDDNFYIDAKQAFFVVGSSKLGSMGSTLASFLHKDDAKQFAKKFGGHVHTYDELSLEMVMH